MNSELDIVGDCLIRKLGKAPLDGEVGQQPPLPQYVEGDQFHNCPHRSSGSLLDVLAIIEKLRAKSFLEGVD
jgi:hypothetical protein